MTEDTKQRLMKILGVSELKNEYEQFEGSENLRFQWKIRVRVGDMIHYAYGKTEEEAVEELIFDLWRIRCVIRPTADEMLSGLEEAARVSPETFRWRRSSD